MALVKPGNATIHDISSTVVKLGWPVILTDVIIHKYNYMVIQGLTF